MESLSHSVLEIAGMWTLASEGSQEWEDKADNSIKVNSLSISKMCCQRGMEDFRGENVVLGTDAHQQSEQ